VGRGYQLPGDNVKGSELIDEHLPGDPVRLFGAVHGGIPEAQPDPFADR
jgi:hypothetical protein